MSLDRIFAELRDPATWPPVPARPMLPAETSWRREILPPPMQAFDPANLQPVDAVAWQWKPDDQVDGG